MNKSLKIAVTVLMIIATIMTFSYNVFAADIQANALQPNYTGDTTQMANIAQNVMGLIRNIAIVAGVIVLMVIGVKYIMGSAAEKAEYKKSLIPLVVGILIVIFATTLVSFIFDLSATAAK